MAPGIITWSLPFVALTDALGNKRHTFWDVRDRQTAAMDELENGEAWTLF